MLKKLFPKQHTFFEFFSQAADMLSAQTEEFSQMVMHLDKAKTHAENINQYERKADAIALLSYQLLHRTFITPFDRYDINNLTTQLDDILDAQNRLAQRFVIYQLTSVPAAFIEMTELNKKIVYHVREVINKLDSLSNQDQIVNHGLEIDRLENEAEAVLLNGISQLFSEENDFKRLLKLKELYEHMKLVINGCQDVVNLVKSIFLEYS